MAEGQEGFSEIEELVDRLDDQDLEALGLAKAVTLASVAIMTWFRYTGGWECAGENRTNGPSRS